jgi:hypothetical protein
MNNLKEHTLHQYVSKFIMCFIKFWMKLDKFTMVKVANHFIIAMDKWIH